MSIDERLEFLLQSTESLHATAAEHTEQLRLLDARMKRNDERWERIERAVRAGLEAWFDENENNNGESGER